MRHKPQVHNIDMDAGEGPTAIFIHGAGGGAWEWAIWRRVFAARGWPTQAIELQACASGLAATRLEDYGAQVQTVCAGASSPSVIIGASLGGLLALKVAATVRPQALVLINPLAPEGISPRPPPRDYPVVIPWGRERSLASTRRALADADDATCLFAFRRWRDESGAVMRAVLRGVAVPAPACPLLVLASERDDDVPPATSRAVAEEFRADFRLLAGASHVGPLLGRRAALVAEDTWRWCDAQSS